MITYNKESLNRIAQSLEKMAGVNPDPPSPSGGNVMKVTFTEQSRERTNRGLEYVFDSDKTIEEVANAIKSGAYVYGEINYSESEDSIDCTVVPLTVASSYDGTTTFCFDLPSITINNTSRVVSVSNTRINFESSDSGYTATGLDSNYTIPFVSSGS